MSDNRGDTAAAHGRLLLRLHFYLPGSATGDPLPKELGYFSSASEMEVFRVMLAYSAISRERWPLQVVPSNQRRRRELIFPPLLTQESNTHAARRPTVHAHARQKWRPRIDIPLS